MLSIKEAGRYANHLSRVLQRLMWYTRMTVDALTTRITITHYKSEVIAEIEDEVEIIKNEDIVVDVTLDEIHRLIDEVTLEKVRVSTAINRAKSKVIIDLDDEQIGLDAALELCDLLKNKSDTFIDGLISNYKEETLEGRKVGLFFNDEGNQKVFIYNTEINKKIMFDKNEYRKKSRQISIKVDYLCDQIEFWRTKKIVDFEPRFSYLDTIEEMFNSI